METIINEYKEQYIKYMELNRKLIEMFESENVDENWIPNYHKYNHVWINSWKEVISFKDLVKINIEDENAIFKKIEKSLSENRFSDLKFDNKSKIEPFQPFDIISDEVWTLFNKNKNNDNKSSDDKISLLKGNKKIIICLNEFCYSVRYLNNNSNRQYINEYNEFLVEFDSKKKEKMEILKEIANSNIDDWMKTIGFKLNSREFKLNKNNISFNIKQKYNNWNFNIIQKYGNTNICAVMRALSTIEPLTDYFMNNINVKEISDEKSLLNSFRNYFIELWSNKKEIFMPQEFCENIKNLSFNIVEEQDPIKFLRLILDYLNEKLNKKDSNLDFNFNNIKEQLNKLCKNPENLNDLNKIINESNSIIGQLFYGLVLVEFTCEHCKKNINEKITKFDIIDINYLKIAKTLYDDEDNSLAFVPCDKIDYYIQENLKLDGNNHLTEECNICKNKAVFKKEILSYPPFLLIRLNRGEFIEKKGFINNFDIPKLIIEYDKITFMNDIIKKKYKKHKNIEYELISAVNYFYYKDKNKIEFTNISKSPFLIEDEVWISFMCNHKPAELKNSTYKNNILLPCILLYKLKEK